MLYPHRRRRFRVFAYAHAVQKCTWADFLYKNVGLNTKMYGGVDTGTCLEDVDRIP